MGAVDQVVLRGRDRELTVLRRALGEARDGRGGGLVVLGEPGSGRTALLAAARPRPPGSASARPGAWPPNATSRTAACSSSCRS
ncbi:AAA family ATPase [Amycolatopsis methanolica]|uniref:AAA family ATPase n=1 Tax=Amycolatopsis methanolica TaxID=1814 RepID=UPI0009D9571E|nr:AAA family ATPase [Amycolatopsis methanolica]